MDDSPYVELRLDVGDGPYSPVAGWMHAVPPEKVRAIRELLDLAEFLSKSVSKWQGVAREEGKRADAAEASAAAWHKRAKGGDFGDLLAQRDRALAERDQFLAEVHGLQDLLTHYRSAALIAKKEDEPMEDPTCACGHKASEHRLEVGCLNGWEYDHEGIALTDGCHCQWAHLTSPRE